jgi:hypothetical protein
VTPVYNNNPGFGILKIDDSTLYVETFDFHFLQLEDYHRFGVYTYEKYDPTLETKIDLNDA